MSLLGIIVDLSLYLGESIVLIGVLVVLLDNIVIFYDIYELIG